MVHLILLSMMDHMFYWIVFAAYYTLSNYLAEDGTYVFEDVQNEESLNYLLTISGATSVDLRNVKNRYDDLIVIVEKNKNIIFGLEVSNGSKNKLSSGDMI
jgi:hypothetical protein